MDPQSDSVTDGLVFSFDKHMANLSAQGTEETMSRKKFMVAQSARAKKVPKVKANIGAKRSMNLLLRAKTARSNQVS